MNREDELARLKAEIGQLRADNAQLKQILTRALTQIEANQALLERISAQSTVLQQGAAQQSTSSDDLTQDGVTELGARSASPPPSHQARPDRQRGGRASPLRQPSRDVADHGPTTDDPPPARRRDFTEEQIKSLVDASKILQEYGRQHHAEHPELYLPIDPATARFEICNDHIIGIDEARKVAVATGDPVCLDILRKAQAEPLTDEENSAYYESLNRDDAVRKYYSELGYFVRHEEHRSEELSGLRSRLRPLTTAEPRQARITLGRPRRDPRQPFIVEDGQTIECMAHEQVEYALTIYDAQLVDE